MIALLLALQVANVPDMNLRCEGVSTRPQDHVTTAETRNSDGDTVATTLTTPGVRTFPERLHIRLAAGAAQIEVPRSMRPVVSQHGDGWWPLYDLRVGETEITGRFRLNAFNKPLVQIDRISGTITAADGAWGFRGTCTPDDPSQRKF